MSFGWYIDLKGGEVVKIKPWTRGLEDLDVKNEALSRANYEHGLKVDAMYRRMWKRDDAWFARIDVMCAAAFSYAAAMYPALEQCKSCRQLMPMGGPCSRCIPEGRVACPFTHTEGKKCIACKGLGHVEELK